MQSPQKLRSNLDDLLGPPGPDSDPLELTLRTVVATTAPMLDGVLAQYDAEGLDGALEGVALYFLKLRSDESRLSVDFLEQLGKLQAVAARGPAIDAHAVDESRDLPPAGDAHLQPADPPASSAPAAPASPVTPAPSSPADPPPAPGGPGGPSANPHAPDQASPVAADTGVGETPATEGAAPEAQPSESTGETSPKPSSPTPPWG